MGANMEDLKRLVQIVVQRKQRQYPLLELKSVNEHSSKENIFFRYIKKGILDSDNEAAKLLYGAPGDDDRYRMLKSRLKQKLLNHLFFLDFAEGTGNSAHEYEQECLHYLHQAKMLEFVSEQKINRGLIQKALTIAERCEFTKHRLTCLEELIRVYSNSCQPHLFEDTVEAYRKLQEWYSEEEEARTIYLRMEMMLVKSVNSRKKNLENAEEAIKVLEKNYKKTKSFNVFECLMKLKVLYFSLTGQYQSLIPFLEELEAGKFKDRKLNPYRLDKKYIVLSMGWALLRAGQWKKGLEYLEDRRKIFSHPDADWYRFMEIFYMIAVRDRNYKLGFQLVESVLESKNFNKLDITDQEKWRLYNAYINYANAGNFYMRHSNFDDFIKEIPAYDKDREGFQVAVLFLQILYFTEQGNMVALKKRRDIIKKYMANHFKENFSYRTRTFYKLTNIVVENKLDLRQIQNKTRYLLGKLPNNQIINDAFREMEIIPYEQLWDLLLDSLRYLKTHQYQADQ